MRILKQWVNRFSAFNLLPNRLNVPKTPSICLRFPIYSFLFAVCCLIFVPFRFHPYTVPTDFKKFIVIVIIIIIIIIISSSTTIIIIVDTNTNTALENLFTKLYKFADPFEWRRRFPDPSFNHNASFEFESFSANISPNKHVIINGLHGSVIIYRNVNNCNLIQFSWTSFALCQFNVMWFTYFCCDGVAKYLTRLHYGTP